MTKCQSGSNKTRVTQNHFFSYTRVMNQKNIFQSFIFWGVALVIFIFPWTNNAGVTNPLMFQFFNFSFLSWLAVVVLGVGLITKQLSIPKSPLIWLVAVLLFTKIISILFSPLPVRNIFGSYMFMADGLLFFLELIFLGYFLLSLAPTKNQIRQFLFVLFLQTSIIAIQIIFEAISLGAPLQNVRATSPLLNADYAISYFCVMIPVGIGLIIYNKKRQREILQAFLVSGLILSCIAIYYLLPNSLQILRHANPSNSSSQKISGFLNNDSNSERFTQWKYGLQIGLDHPLIGIGLGTTRAYFFEQVKDSKTWDYSIDMILPHNDLIQQFSQTGLLGLLAYVILWSAFTAIVIKNRNIVLPEERPIFYGGLVGLVAFLIFNQFIFTTLYSAIIVLVVACFLLILCKGVEFRPSKGMGESAVIILLFIIFIIGFPSLYYLYNYRLAEIAFYNSRLAEQAGDYREATKQIDLAINDFPYEENYYQVGSGDHAIYAQLLGYDQSQFAIAKSQIKKSLELNPFLPKSYLNQGIIDFLAAEDKSLQQKKAEAEIFSAINRQKNNLYFYKYALQALGPKVSQEIKSEFVSRIYNLAPEQVKIGLKIN